MKSVLIILLANVVLLGFFQNCHKNQAIRMESISSEGTSTTVDAAQAANLPPMSNYKQCALPSGTLVDHLYVSWGLRKDIDGKTCDLFEMRQCYDGAMNPPSPGFNETGCDVAKLPPSATQNPCQIDGKTISHGQIVFGFHSRLVTGSNNCIAQVRRCNNGILTGSSEYSYTNCTDALYQPASGKAIDCEFNGSKVSDGATVLAFLEESPTGNCSFEPRRCIQGVLSGKYTKRGCTPKEAP